MTQYEETKESGLVEEAEEFAVIGFWKEDPQIGVYRCYHFFNTRLRKLGFRACGFDGNFFVRAVFRRTVISYALLHRFLRSLTRSCTSRIRLDEPSMDV